MKDAFNRRRLLAVDILSNTKYIQTNTPNGAFYIYPDVSKVIEKRVYDIAGLSSNKIKVSLNGELINIKTFQDYVNLYIGNKKE